MSNQESTHLISLQEDGLYLLDLNEVTSLKLDLPFTLPTQTEPVCILHCHGMLCLTLKGNKELAIWKPGSEEFERIPMVKPGAGQTTNPLGFGYDKASDDYKIVTIINHKTYIYAFKEKSWRKSVPDTSLDRIFKDRAGTAAGNCMYWIADRSHINKSSKINSILCFDFVKEEYQEWEHPLNSKWKMSSWLGFLREEFRLIEHYPWKINNIYVWHLEDPNIHKWCSVTRINMRKTLEGLKKFDVRFGFIARNDEIFIVVKGRGDGEDTVMVYDEGQEKFIDVPFGSCMKGFRCMTNYICQ